MIKLWKKDEVWFAICWILVYVVGFSNADLLSEAIGIPKILTACLGLILSAVFLAFLHKNQLFSYYGLRRFKERPDRYLYFIPLMLITSVNLWHGFSVPYQFLPSVCYIVSMCCVGFLEEIIFRGFLFKGMAKTNLKAAVIVSSLSFGFGHIVNLFLGEPLFETLLQLIYASAVGFCFTALFWAGGSLIPCILSHALVNSTSLFAAEATDAVQVAVTVAITVISVAYGGWLMCKHPKSGG